MILSSLTALLDPVDSAASLRGARRTSAAKASAQEWTGNGPQPIAH